MAIFDEIKARGVQDILFISMDGVSGLEEGAKAIFPNVTVQRCIVHLIRNSLKYIPSNDYKEFCEQLKKVYGASALKATEAEFEKFKTRWSQYPGAVVPAHTGTLQKMNETPGIELSVGPQSTYHTR